MQILQPPGWPRPKGYSNGVVASGKMVFVSGIIGWDKTETIVSDYFAEQFRQVLKNTLAILAEANAKPSNIVRMTAYITNREEYLEAARSLAPIWQEIMGMHYPAMAFVQVAGLLEPRAKVEIETTAMIPS